MTSEEIIRRQEAVPFVPYALFLADRRELAVEHPEFVAIEPDSSTFLLMHSTGYAEVIDLRLIISLKFRSGEFIDEPLIEQ